MSDFKRSSLRLATLFCLLAGIFDATICGAAPSGQTGQSPGVSETAIDESDFSNFDAWAHGYIHTPSATARAAAELKGQELAIKRKASLLRLIQSDPELALQFAVPQITK